MSSVSVFHHRFFIVAPFLLGSVLLHLLLAVWGAWNMVQPEPEPALLEPQVISIGLISPALVKKVQANPAPLPVKIAAPKPAARTAPSHEPVNPAPERPSLPEPKVSTEIAAIPAQDLTPNSFSPEVLSESVVREVLSEPMDPGEFIITRSPASAYLHYEVSLRRGGERLNGSGNLLWEWRQDRYRIEITAHVIIQVSKQVSAGAWQLDAGLAPQTYSDQRGLRSENRVEFERQAQPPQLYFSGNNSRTALQPGVQDYASLIMQLSSLLASNSDNFYIGTAVRFPVADARKSREMIFQLQAIETLDTGLGRLQAWRFSYQPVSGSNDRTIDVWFARDLDWLPVQLRFADAGRGEVIEFSLRRREAL